VEGSAVDSSGSKYEWKRRPTLCHPERSREPALSEVEGDMQFYRPVLEMFFEEAVGALRPEPSLRDWPRYLRQRWSALSATPCFQADVLPDESPPYGIFYVQAESPYPLGESSFSAAVKAHSSI
jgi:hypothetical protein